MNTFLRRATSTALVLLSVPAAPSGAGEVEAIFAEVATVQDGRGLARILFRPTPIPFDEYTVVERATLRIPYSGDSESRTVPLRVCVVTADWSQGARWDTAYDPQLFALSSAESRSGAGTAVFDVTALMMEILEDSTPSFGFVLTGGPKESAGIAGEDASRFGSLAGAELEIVTTMFPSKRPPHIFEEDQQGSE